MVTKSGTLRYRRKPKKISFFGNFGQGNLGNESTLQAILYNLRRYLPAAEVNCICTGPEATTTTHDIPAIPIHDLYVKPEFLRGTPLARWLRKVFIGVPLEFYRWIVALRTLHDTDLLIVPGTQFLSDNLTGPFGWPYLAFRWCLAAKLRHCQLLFVSVGVGPLRHALSRFFVRSALSLADFRSYRDDQSRQYLRRIGFDSSRDSVYPDLAFSLPASPNPRTFRDDIRTLTIAVGVKDYHGQYDPQSRRAAGAVYQQYIDKLAAFVAWLLDHRYTIRLVIGDVAYDTQVVADLKTALNGRAASYESSQILDDPIKSVEQLASQLEKSDLVVSPRFHNVVLGLLLGKPVIAISYHEKFSALLDSPELAQYNVEIDRFDIDSVIPKVEKLQAHRQELSLHIRTRVDGYRAALEEQYTLIFDDPWRRRPPDGTPHDSLRGPVRSSAI